MPSRNHSPLPKALLPISTTTKVNDIDKEVHWNHFRPTDIVVDDSSTIHEDCKIFQFLSASKLTRAYTSYSVVVVLGGATFPRRQALKYFITHCKSCKYLKVSFNDLLNDKNFF